jgi:hypothetical protein
MVYAGYHVNEKREAVSKHPARVGHEVFPMRNLQSIRRTVQSVVLAVAAWMGGAAMVLAQGAPGAKGASATESSSSWVAAYMVVLLVVSLGLMVVCKSSGRRDRAKPEVYAEAKSLPKE